MTGATPSALIGPDVPYVTITVPVFVPSLSPLGSNVTVSVAPCGPTVPLAGVTVIHGLSPCALNVAGGFCGGSAICCVTPFCTLTSALVVCVCGGRTTVL